ncbi:MAG: prepilin-type N-terminal cleavage/methylation domain-containing protein [Candidatus Rokuibacteriota bacterium]
MTRMNQRGVTMIELLLAMLLLAVALVGLAASFPLAMVGVATGGYQTTATLLAQQCIDIAKSISYDSFGYSQIPAQLAAACPDGAVTGYGGFTRTTTIAPASPTAQTTTITVVVSFSGGGGGINDTTLSTVLAQ